MTIVAAALAAYARTVERAFEARSQTIGASEIGRCARQLFLKRRPGSWRAPQPRLRHHLTR